MPQSAGALESTPPPKVAVVGVPFDSHSSFLRGPALAPARIRLALRSGSMNWCTEDGVDLDTRADWRDVGDLGPDTGATLYADIEGQMNRLIAPGTRVLTLGGDHSITYPILRAHASHYSDLAILHIDAHPDLYDEYDGSKLSHASPFARILEERLATRLVQVGIRAMNPHQRQQADRFGAEVIAMRDYRPDLALRFAGPLYISLDVDALDPAFAPGVSHYEPGGFSVREVLTLLGRVEATVVGADIVEYNPVRDVSDRTAIVAAKFYKELVGRMLA